MNNQLTTWLEMLGLTLTPALYAAFVIGIIVATAAILHIILHHIVLRTIKKQSQHSDKVWQQAFAGHNLFSRLALLVQGIVVYVQVRIWLESGSTLFSVIEVALQLWILLFILLAFFALLDTLLTMISRSAVGRKMPFRGIFQALKLIAALLAGIFMVSLLIGKSPVILFSGLGAMTAVLMLVFKDPIMGFVAGIQLSANNMLSVGDWLEMPKYGADGDVIDITLTTVKVRNWDNTITTVPAYALISDSFKNWRGMSESGGRRIKRSVFIDASSVHFLNDEDLSRLRKAQLLSHYIEDRLRDIDDFNRKNKIDSSSPVNGRRMTNLGTFRAYLTAYLKNHSGIHSGMIQMVRQMEATANGIPMEVYAFCNDTAWVAYEGIQSDIFDHVLAVLPEFGLRVHQTPTGHDMQQIGKNLPAT